MKKCSNGNQNYPSMFISHYNNAELNNVKLLNPPNVQCRIPNVYSSALPATCSLAGGVEYSFLNVSRTIRDFGPSCP